MLKKLIISATLLGAPTAQAGVIIGSSELLNAAAVEQMELWIGKGPLTLTNLFTKTPDRSTAKAFHQAVDDRGPGLAIANVSEDNGKTWKIVGGYSPLGWSSKISGEYFAPSDTFIFNLSNNEKRELTRRYLVSSRPEVGPFFYSDFSIAGNLSGGFTHSWAFGNLPTGRSLLDGSHSSGVIKVREFEVFGLEPYKDPEPVPEPASLALMGAGLLGLMLIRHRKPWKRH
ncbi:PEP_CTERM-anchored TLD domain-containing protein [Massilia sp. YIM B04103]|uniref:PEP_CTERM-anchored TLD domain-containing protein n=1 Tax=Massilia sp. YIM B04103 TaxID=2963106 RepID=UPI0021086A0F|nr:PEP_CTERM-anchored TLD domain-containing protein [Massilia sp. YIM B04103]